MTTIDRATVEQALHVAENAGYPLALIKALRAALAQQAKPVEPVARIRTWHKDGEQHAELRVWEDGIEGLPDGEHLLYTAPPQQAEPQPTPSMDEITRLRAERDALADRLREVRAQLNDTIDRHRQKVVMNAWAEQRLARHGIPMPEGDTK